MKNFIAVVGATFAVVGVTPSIATAQTPTQCPPGATNPAYCNVPTTPAKDPDGDGIRNDWLVNGKQQAAPRAAAVARVRANSVALRLPKAAKNVRLRVYVRVAGAKHTFKAVATTRSRTLTVKHLKRATRYEFKLVAVNKANKNSRASKTLKVTTKRH